MYLSLQEFREYIEDKYDVRFKSNQSYSTLDEAKIRWNKNQKNNKKNYELLEKKDRNRENFGRKQRRDRSGKTCGVYD